MNSSNGKEKANGHVSYDEEQSLSRKLTRSASKAFTSLMLLPIRFYQVCISPLTPPACRFTPTCSEYARQAIIIHGPVRGLYLAIRRILRCHPWGDHGYDPVPPK